MALSDAIIYIRKKGFYTQVEFAVNRWENGKMNPNVSAMKRLKAYCDALNIEFGNVEKAWLDRSLEDEKNEKNK